MKVIIVSGISGIDKENFITNFIRKAGIEKKSKIIKFEDELVSPERRRGGVHPPTKITTFLEERSLTIKIRTIEETFSWISNSIAIEPEIEYVFLDVHLIYYKNSEYFPPLNPSNYSEWINSLGRNVDIVIINLIDDVFNIWKTILDKEKQYPNTKLTLREILAWRSLENLQSESLPNALNFPKEGERRAFSYMTSVRHPYSTFENLIFPKIPICVYLSYPITKTRNSPKRVKEVNSFRKRMHDLGKKHKIAIFDPVSIDELTLEQARKLKKASTTTFDKKLRWPLDYSEILVPDTNPSIKIPTKEITESLTQINHQIRSRDLKLVEYSSILAVYRPFFGGLSKGAQAEINHATYVGNEVWIYSSREDKLPGGSSPFDDNSITLIKNLNTYFKKVEQSMIDLKKKTIKRERRLES